MRPIPRLAPALVEGRLAEWRRLLRKSPTQGRAVLQQVLRGRITFTPAGAGYEFSAPTRFDKLFTGIVAPIPAWMPISNEGHEHIGPEQALDGDYGRLLESAERAVSKAKGWRPWRDRQHYASGAMCS